MRPASIFAMSSTSLMTSSRNWPLRLMSRQYSSYFPEPSGPNIRPSMISENPMMALSGVRNSWLMLARKVDFAWFASSARVFSSAYLSASSASCWAWISSACWDLRRSAMVAIRRCSPSTRRELVALDGGDVGADGNVAAVFGAALADVQPASVFELRLERARARVVRICAIGRVPQAHYRLALGRDDLVIGHARGDGFVGKVMQGLEV